MRVHLLNDAGYFQCAVSVGQPADGVHLEDGGGWHQVAHRAVEDGFFSKIVHTGGMKQDEIGFGHEYVSFNVQSCVIRHALSL